MKNPWMSLWLSGANKAAGSGRGPWMAEAQRQQNAWIKSATQAANGGAPSKKNTPTKTRKR